MLRPLILILLAYVAACASVSVVWLLVLVAEPDPVGGDVNAPILAVAFLIVAASAAVIAAVPAFMMIVLAETFGWRSLILHLVVGGGIGLFALLVGGVVPTSVYEFAHEFVPLGLVGATGGFAYWLIAGRRAGSLRGRTPRKTAS